MKKTVVIKQENGEIFRIDLNPKKWFQDFKPVFFGIYCNFKKIFFKDLPVLLRKAIMLNF